MRGTILSLFRHPVKGLTPEPLLEAELAEGRNFPNDRIFAVEVGASGFEPEHPRHITKMRFAVLARFPELARLKTRLDDETGLLSITDETGFGVDIPFAEPESREALSRFIAAFLGGEVSQPLKVLEGPGAHRFTDNLRDGFVSAINIASIRAVERAIGEPVDPARFRANIYYDAGEAFIEDEFERGDGVVMGPVSLKVRKPIERCIATHANPVTGVRDIDMVGALQAHFGRITLGNYLSVERGGRIAPGDLVARGEPRKAAASQGRLFP